MIITILYLYNFLKIYNWLYKHGEDNEPSFEDDLFGFEENDYYDNVHFTAGLTTILGLGVAGMMDAVLFALIDFIKTMIV